LRFRDDEWNRKWRSLPSEQRRRIARAVQRGEAVADPRDAPFAIELSQKRQHRLQSARSGFFSKWSSVHHVAMFGCIGIVGAVLTHNYLVAGVMLLTGVYLIGLRVFLRRLETNAATSRRKNEEVFRL
jgi:hypothetical protein